MVPVLGPGHEPPHSLIDGTNTSCSREAQKIKEYAIKRVWGVNSCCSLAAQSKVNRLAGESGKHLLLQGGFVGEEAVSAPRGAWR